MKLSHYLIGLLLLLVSLSLLALGPVIFHGESSLLSTSRPGFSFKSPVFQGPLAFF